VLEAAEIMLVMWIVILIDCLEAYLPVRVC
jgi:hypothetical protein